jgi:adenylate cyclase
MINFVGIMQNLNEQLERDILICHNDRLQLETISSQKLTTFVILIEFFSLSACLLVNYYYNNKQRVRSTIISKDSNIARPQEFNLGFKSMSMSPFDCRL